jgi:glycosyltransferase involved in cell wall biosynthesis
MQRSRPEGRLRYPELPMDPVSEPTDAALPTGRPAQPRLAIVVPCYDEELVVEAAAGVLCGLLSSLVAEGRVDPSSFVYFVDDGSRDATWSVIDRLHEADPRVKGLKLSRNFGHQSAQLAGLLSVRSRVDCAITIDADLQQDVGAIPRFLESHAKGAEIVFGVRNDRRSDSVLKKLTALVFYRLMRLMGIGTIPNHADYRLVGRKGLEALSQFRESNLFLRGIFSELGFRTDIVRFDVKQRHQGSSKYTPRRMVSLALGGITAFSVAPLRLVAILGLVIFVISLSMAAYIFLFSVITGEGVPGWASTTIPIYVLGGLQILALGVVGEYIGRVYQEAKGRPRYLKDHELF